MEKVKDFIQSNILFTASLVLALISVGLGRFDWSFINYDVIATLFGMMLALGLFQESGLLHVGSIKMVEWSKSSRSLVRNMILLSFIASFFLTNDVAVLTILPIYISIIKSVRSFKGSLLGAVMVPIAANLGGVFFPFSNPQNLIIYDSFQISFTQFIGWTTPLLIISLILVSLTSFFVESKEISSDLETKEMDKSLIGHAVIAMTLMILTVFGLLPIYWTVLAISIWVFISYKKHFSNVNYTLLAIFAAFFVIVGNISEWPLMNQLVNQLISSNFSTYLGGILLSQFISNVPTTILISPFTSNIESLLLGVNIGGLGTLIASLTNLIGYNVFRTLKKDRSWDYLKLFTLVNGIFLIILAILLWFFI